MKTCTKCGIEKDEGEFGKNRHWKDGLQYWCKKCEKEYRIQYKNKLIVVIPETKICLKCNVEKVSKEFAKNKQRKDGLNAYCKECVGIWYKNHYYQNKKDIDKHNRESYRRNIESKRKYAAEHKEQRNQRCRLRGRIRRLQDSCYKLRKNISGSIAGALRRNSGSKRGISCLQFLPYTIQQLKEYLESQFDCYMSWENHGRCDINRYTWQIDHITPQDLLLYDSMEHPNFQKCWALENLRPLRAIDNLKKGNRITEEE